MARPDRLDVCACGRAAQEDIAHAWRAVSAAADDMLPRDALHPSLGDYMRDFEARRAMPRASSRCDALSDLHRELVALHELEQARIPIERALFVARTT